MEISYWLDERYFPDPDEYENSGAYAATLYQEVIDRYGNKHGGDASVLLKKTAESYTDLYAYAIKKDKLILTRHDLEYFADNPFNNDASDAVQQNNADRLATQLRYAGWLTADPDLAFTENDWTEKGTIYVYQKDRRDSGPPIIPSIDTILESLDLTTLVSTTQLSEYVNQRLHQLDRVSTVTSDRRAAYRVAIETGLQQNDWLQIPAQNTTVRLWINPSEAHDTLLARFSDATAVSQDELKDELYSFVHEYTQELEQQLTLDLKEFVEAFYKRLRSDDWGEIKHESGSTWYRTDEAHRKALQEYIDEYGDVFEDPLDADLAADATRQEVHDFFQRNSPAFTRHDFYDYRTLQDNLALLDYLSEADETMKELDGSETKAGTWELPFEFESEQEAGAEAELEST